MRPMIFCNQGGLMIKEEFYFDSRDGENRIHAVRYTPDDGNVRGIVQIVHGMAEYVERYENLAEFLTESLSPVKIIWDMENLFQRVDLSVTFASRILQR